MQNDSKLVEGLFCGNLLSCGRLRKHPALIYRYRIGAAKLTKQGLEVANIFVDVAFARGFVYDVLVIVVPEAAAEFLVVHFWFILPDSPSASHLIWIN